MMMMMIDVDRHQNLGLSWLVRY